MQTSPIIHDRAGWMRRQVPCSDQCHQPRHARFAQFAAGCVNIDRQNHGFVSGIIMRPYFGQARAKLHCETDCCCLKARSGSRSGFLSPPAPRGVDGSGQIPAADFFPQQTSKPELRRNSPGPRTAALFVAAADDRKSKRGTLARPAASCPAVSCAAIGPRSAPRPARVRRRG